MGIQYFIDELPDGWIEIPITELLRDGDIWKTKSINGLVNMGQCYRLEKPTPGDYPAYTFYRYCDFEIDMILCDL